MLLLLLFFVIKFEIEISRVVCDTNDEVFAFAVRTIEWVSECVCACVVDELSPCLCSRTKCRLIECNAILRGVHNAHMQRKHRPTNKKLFVYASMHFRSTLDSLRRLLDDTVFFLPMQKTKTELHTQLHVHFRITEPLIARSLAIDNYHRHRKDAINIKNRIEDKTEHNFALPTAHCTMCRNVARGSCPISESNQTHFKKNEKRLNNCNTYRRVRVCVCLCEMCPIW